MMDASLAKQVLGIVEVNPETVEEAVQAQVFTIRNYLVQNAVVPALFQRRIDNLIKLDHARKALLGIDGESKALKIDRLTREEALSILELHNDSHLDFFFSASGQQASMARMQIVSSFNPAQVAKGALNLVRAEIAFIRLYHDLFGFLATDEQQEEVKVGQFRETENLVLAMRQLGLEDLRLDGVDAAQAKFSAASPEQLPPWALFTRESIRVEKLLKLTW